MEIIEPAEFLVYGSCQIVPRQGIVYLNGKEVESPIVLLTGKLALIKVDRREVNDVLALVTRPNIVGLSEQLHNIVKLAQNGRGVVFICSFVQRILLQFAFRHYGFSRFASFFANIEAPIYFIDEEVPDIEMAIQMCADSQNLFINAGNLDLSRCTCPVMECRDLVSIAASYIDAVLNCFECEMLPLPLYQIARAGEKGYFQRLHFYNCVAFVSSELHENLMQIDLKNRMKAFYAFISNVWCIVYREDGSSDEVRCLGLLYANAQWNLCMMSDGLHGYKCQISVLQCFQ